MEAKKIGGAIIRAGAIIGTNTVFDYSHRPSMVVPSASPVPSSSSFPSVYIFQAPPKLCHVTAMWCHLPSFTDTSLTFCSPLTYRTKLEGSEI